MKAKLINLLSRLALVGAAVAITSCATQPDGFKQADRDNDEKLSRQEVGNALLNAIYNAGDENGDAKITLAEWQKVDPQCDKTAFALRDSNDDGAVTPEELKAYSVKKKSFDSLYKAMDANNDGFIDRAEAVAFNEKLSNAPGKSDLEKLLNTAKQ